MNNISYNLYISCGEASGELYGSLLAYELLKINPNLKITGMGGNLLQEAGVKIIQPINKLQIIGTFELLPKIIKLYLILSNLKKQLAKNPPQLSILIDFPDFHFIIGKFLKTLNIPIIYYVSPQIWAWRTSRVYKMKQFIDLMIPLFEFEESFYKKAGIKTFFAGHPLIDYVSPNNSKKIFIDKYNINKCNFLLGIMPGSRLSEIKHHTPVLIQVLNSIKNEYPDVAFLLIKAPTVSQSLMEPYQKLGATIIIEDKYDAMCYSDLLLVASGTATIEACIAETPMIVFYKVNNLSWTFGHWLIKTKYLCMVNICADEEIVPECYQNLFNVNKILELTKLMINSKELRNNQIKKLQNVKNSLGNKGASKRIAEFIYSNYIKNYNLF